MNLANYICALLVAVLASNLQAQDTDRIRGIAEKVSADVATAKDARVGFRGRPVFIVEEYHNSRKLQIEAAVCLVRLYDHTQLRDIALEGYIIDGRAISTKWYAEVAGSDFGARVRVAVQLLKEGEIRCAEFMALTYDDCVLHPIDKADEHTALAEVARR